jgi:hypothetical protein
MAFSSQHPGSSSFLILMAKSKTQTVQGKNALANSVCQAMASRQNDFAISIKSAQEPERGFERHPLLTESGSKMTMFSGRTSYGIAPLQVDILTVWKMPGSDPQGFLLGQ